MCNLTPPVTRESSKTVPAVQPSVYMPRRLGIQSCGSITHFTGPAGS
jgi:hypothetical protein